MKTHKLSCPEKQKLKAMLKEDCGHIPPDAVMDTFLDAGDVYEVEKWDHVIEASQYDTNMYIIMDGLVRVWFWDGDKEKTVYFSTIPTVLLNYHSYFGNEPSFYNYQACTRLKVLRIGKKDFDRMNDMFPELTRWCLTLAYGQLYYFELKHKVNLGDSKERYLSLIRTLPDIIQEVPLQIIAQYLDITPQYLSKLRRDLCK